METQCRVCISLTLRLKCDNVRMHQTNIKGSRLQWSVIMANTNCQKMRQQMEALLVAEKSVGIPTARMTLVVEHGPHHQRLFDMYP